MQTTPLRLMTTALWPLAIWPSIFNFDKHPADDYAERTFPLIATAIGFWVCAGLLVYTALQNGVAVSIADADGEMVRARLVPLWVDHVAGVLWFFLPALYVIGLWLYVARDEAFPQ